ncbi:MAG: hypothetical protein MZV63_37850 [Marinilabiliales bacterium]|nr:hypothetical protein [Marinilabiliales bacterium]
MAEPIKNLFTFNGGCLRNLIRFHFSREKYNNREIRYGDLKKQLAEDIIGFTTPIRERIIDISSNDEYLRKVMKIGCRKGPEQALRRQ